MSGGGGGGGPYYDVPKAEIRALIDKASDSIAEGFLPELERILGDKLVAYNSRDRGLMNKRRDEIKAALSDVLEEGLNLPYGGSVAKHTDVNGLSDVDALLVMKGVDDTRLKPSEIRKMISSELRGRLVDVAVSEGRLAVTVRYKDGMDVQLVPCIREGKGYKVPSWQEDRWSRIAPESFRRALTDRNEQVNGRLIPVIKLAKAIIATWPSASRLSGYHVESLAIEAFRSYSGNKTVAKMLPTFFEQAANLVLSPIRDKTGQSVNVDGYLGRSHSTERKKARHWCSQTAKRMKRASLQGSRTQWEDLFD